MATEETGRMTPEEAQAVVRLWSQRQWERRHWPTVADVSEGLDISIAEAEALLREIRTHPGLARADSPPRPQFWEADFLWRLTAGVAGLTTIFSLFLNRFLG